MQLHNYSLSLVNILWKFLSRVHFGRIQINLFLRACSSKGRIVSSSGQIFRSDFRPQDEIFRPGMPFRPLDEQALTEISPQIRNDLNIFVWEKDEKLIRGNVSFN